MVISRLATRRLRENHRLLHRQYRLGNSEERIGFVQKAPVDDGADQPRFYLLCDGKQAAKAETVSFEEAAADLYQLVKYLDERNLTVDGVLHLRCRCLVYEVMDYLLKVPEDLGEYFKDLASRFSGAATDVERIAEDLHGGPFTNRNERAKVIKLHLIAAIWGANQMYREHNQPSYNRAYAVLERVNGFIQKELPNQHESPRESFGILGLAQYVTGRVLSRKGLTKESREAFRNSADAYLARLRQKEDYHRQGRLKLEEYEEKIAVTIRRSALVAAFGDGYHHFLSGQLTKALESLTVARAALTRNAGRVYVVYVEMLYWACHRAARSSDIEMITKCVRELRACRENFWTLIPNSPYFHRAGIQLALALLCHANLQETAEEPDFNEALDCLEAAIAYAKQPAYNRDRDYLNPSLLAGALITKSRYFRARAAQSLASSKPEEAFEFLSQAQSFSERAHDAVIGMRAMQSEASATLGEIHVDMAELNLSFLEEKFADNFKVALDYFQRARKENRGQNPRSEAVCLLGLTRLCLLNPNTEIAAREYFAQWKSIETLVEHDYCKTLANELARRFNPRDFVINIAESLSLKDWSAKLETHLINEALKEFVGATITNHIPTKELRTQLADYLQATLGFGSTKSYKVIKERGLLEEVKRMKQDPDAKAQLSITRKSKTNTADSR